MPTSIKIKFNYTFIKGKCVRNKVLVVLDFLPRDLPARPHQISSLQGALLERPPCRGMQKEDLAANQFAEGHS